MKKLTELVVSLIVPDKQYEVYKTLPEEKKSKVRATAWAVMVSKLFVLFCILLGLSCGIKYLLF